jgi:hypothetical protein
VVVDSRFDGGLTGGTIRGALQVGGYLRGTVTFGAGSSVSGTAIFGGSSGRGVRDTYRFIDPAYTIPAGFSVVSSTRYDSNMVFDATATALTIEGEITVGYSSFQQDFWSDSVTFNVASLQTHGKTTVTSDGRLYVNGGYWSHSGELQLTGGVIEAADIAIESPGSLYGWGSITGDVTVDGQLTAPAAGKQLRIIGSLKLGEGATTNLILGSDPDSSPLSVEGAATLGGALSVGLSPALLAAGLAIGDRFTIASASSLSGAFDEISASLPWLTLESVDSASEVVLEVSALSGVPSLRGDGNHDGFIDAADYTVWRDHVGQQVPWFTSGDFDGSGFVDESDRAVWTAAYGSAAAPAFVAPEPTSLATVALFCAVAQVRGARTVRRSLASPFSSL